MKREFICLASFFQGPLGFCSPHKNFTAPSSLWFWGLSPLLVGCKESVLGTSLILFDTIPYTLPCLCKESFYCIFLKFSKNKSILLALNSIRPGQEMHRASAHLYPGRDTKGLSLYSGVPHSRPKFTGRMFRYLSQIRPIRYLTEVCFKKFFIWTQDLWFFCTGSGLRSRDSWSVVTFTSGSCVV